MCCFALGQCLPTRVGTNTSNGGIALNFHNVAAAKLTINVNNTTVSKSRFELRARLDDNRLTRTSSCAIAITNKLIDLSSAAATSSDSASIRGSRLNRLLSGSLRNSGSNTSSKGSRGGYGSRCGSFSVTAGGVLTLALLDQALLGAAGSPLRDRRRRIVHVCAASDVGSDGHGACIGLDVGAAKHRRDKRDENGSLHDDDDYFGTAVLNDRQDEKEWT
jgi:hypothetical protein